MQRLYGFALPVLMMSGAIPTIPVIPTLQPPGAVATGIVADDEGVVYFVDSFHDVVWRAVPGRTPSVMLDAREGRALDMEENGDVVVRDLPGQPRLQDAHASRALARFPAVGGISRARNGDLLVATGSTVRRVAADGSVRTVADDPLLRARGGLIARLLGTSHDHLTGIATDDAGVIYVANSSRGTVVCVRPDGRVYDVAISEKGWTPTGIATSRAGVFVLEYGNGVRVRRLGPNGTGGVVVHVRPDRVAATLPVGRSSVLQT